jgi:hypothetical protein
LKHSIIHSFLFFLLFKQKQQQKLIKIVNFRDNHLTKTNKMKKFFGRRTSTSSSSRQSQSQQKQQQQRSQSQTKLNIDRVNNNNVNLIKLPKTPTPSIQSSSKTKTKVKTNKNMSLTSEASNSNSNSNSKIISNKNKENNNQQQKQTKTTTTTTPNLTMPNYDLIRNGIVVKTPIYTDKILPERLLKKYNNIKRLQNDTNNNSRKLEKKYLNFILVIIDTQID